MSYTINILNIYGGYAMRGEKDLFKLDNMLKSLNYAVLGGG